MTSTAQLHKEGDHRLVAVPTAATEVTFHLSSPKTSSSDNSSTKYFDNFATGASEFSLVANQAIQLLGLNGTDFTDAIPMAANANFIENWGDYTQIKIKTTTVDTSISLRVR